MFDVRESFPNKGHCRDLTGGGEPPPVWDNGFGNSQCGLSTVVELQSIHSSEAGYALRESDFLPLSFVVTQHIKLKCR